MSEGKPKHSYITVETLYRENVKRLQLEIVSGKGSFKKHITEKDLHRPGLALAGFVDLFTFHRVQVCGNTEQQYLKKLTSDQREKILANVFSFDIPCVIVTSEEEISGEFTKLAEKAQITVFRTPLDTTRLIQLIGDYLDEKFAPQVYKHGSMVDVYGVGVMISGRSGIGKSEVALDLVSRGHQLVADDVVTISRRTGGFLMAEVNETLLYHMEIRGLGIIDIHAMFGIRGIRKQKKIEVQVELVDWDKSEKYERLGLKEMTTEILSVQVPLVRLPIYPGKNISMIVEVVALNQKLKLFGHNAAVAFEEQLMQRINKQSNGLKGNLEHIFE